MSTDEEPEILKEFFNNGNDVEEGLCQNCKDWVFPEEGFCPFCGDEFIDIKDKEE